MRVLLPQNSLEMTLSFCHLLRYVTYALVAGFNVANMSFSAIHENTILAKFHNLQYGQMLNSFVNHCLLLLPLRVFCLVTFFF